MGRITLAAGLVVIGVAGAVWSSSELARGVAEVPEHWWSTMAVAPAVLGALVMLGPVARRVGQAAK
jgi:hypothetical protein